MGQVPERSSAPGASGQPSTPRNGDWSGWERTTRASTASREGAGARGSPAVAASKTAALWKVFPRLNEPKRAALQRIAVAPEQPTFHNYEPSIRAEKPSRRWMTRIVGD